MALVPLLVAGSSLPPPAPTAIGAVPDEPGAFTLPERPTYQAVVADVDGDGVREVVRLVRGERGAIEAEIWRFGEDGWRALDSTVQVIPTRPRAAQPDPEYAGTPARLIVRSIEGADRVTIVRQPRFQEPDIVAGCCLLLADLVVLDGRPRLVAVADPMDGADAVIALDLDGDGTDELLATRSIPPIGDTSFPTEARVLRWVGDAFAPPVRTQLPIGSGDSPFVLGDSDGEPGEEAAIIGTLGRSALYRLSLAEGDAMRHEDAGVVATAATAVPVEGGRGVAVVGPLVGLSVHRWPAGGSLGDVIGQLSITDGALLGAVRFGDTTRVLVRRPGGHTLHVLELPTLSPLRAAGVVQSPAAATFVSSPIAPYVGPLPGGGLDGEPAVIAAGWLIPSAGETVGAAMIATLAGAQPVGLAGPDRDWLALLHAPAPRGRLDPAGGRLDPPMAEPGSAVSLAPIETVIEPEANDGSLGPETTGARSIGPLGRVVTGPDGFVAEVVAPAGSRVYVGASDRALLDQIAVVPASGRLPVRIAPPSTAASAPRYRSSVSVTTPAGHGYVASWQVRVLDRPPSLEASARTSLGSSEVTIVGRTDLHAEVTVAGATVPTDPDGRFTASVALPPWPTDVSIVAVDPVGNVASLAVSGVGLLDYRALPWIPIVVTLVALAAAVLFLRVPRSKPASRRADDDARLEELEPD